MSASNRTTADKLAPLVVDTRPVFDRGGTPCSVIDDAVRQLKPGQGLVLLVPFEPVPLYAKLGNLGFECQAEELPDGVWRAEFRRTADAPEVLRSIPKCDCH